MRRGLLRSRPTELRIPRNLAQKGSILQIAKTILPRVLAARSAPFRIQGPSMVNCHQRRGRHGWLVRQCDSIQKNCCKLHERQPAVRSYRTRILRSRYG